MPIRNPFARRPQDDTARPTLAVPSPPAFERVDTTGSKASSVSVNSRRSQDTGEYKLSVVNDSGIYLPPSPTEEKPSWPRRGISRNSSDNRSDHGEIEHFSISRESFDSYRRSFDISARSPIINGNEYSRGRQSLDSSRFQRLPRSSLQQQRRLADEPSPQEEDAFEDVGLQDEPDKPEPPQPRKRGFFSKLTESSTYHNAANGDGAAAAAATTPTTSTGSRFSILPGRKRGQSGQGQELGAMDRPTTGTVNPELHRVDSATTVITTAVGK